MKIQLWTVGGATLLGLALLGSNGVSQAQDATTTPSTTPPATSTTPPAQGDVRNDTQGIRQDRKDIRQDKGDLREDRRERRQDRRELREDRREGASQAELENGVTIVGRRRANRSYL
ncbi:MAG: hypothetical protein E6K64_03010 [Nitrospirae bacterium]|nr:MAG: hypothetical protein E6K64_03010 [Nitrospirota bacterium]